MISFALLIAALVLMVIAALLPASMLPDPWRSRLALLSFACYFTAEILARGGPR